MPAGIANGERLTRAMLKADFEKRFWAKVNKAGRHRCWLWTGALQKNGSGSISAGGDKVVIAQRAAWVLHHGVLEAGMVVKRCTRNARCVRAGHLELVTAKRALQERKRPPALNWAGAQKVRAMLPTHSYQEIAAEVGFPVPTVSNAARNISYHDPDYTPIRPRNSCCKLTHVDELALRRRVKAGEKVHHLAEEYGVAQSTLWYYANDLKRDDVHARSKKAA